MQTAVILQYPILQSFAIITDQRIDLYIPFSLERYAFIFHPLSVQFS